MAKKNKASSDVREDLASLLADELNKKAGEKVAFFLDDDTDAASDVKQWISTGITGLNLAISNRPNGGYPMGRIVELTGLEAAGKSLVAATAIKETQRAGGVGVYIDTEYAADKAFMDAIGIDRKKMLYLECSTVEKAFENADYLAARFGDMEDDRPVTIVIDSIMGAKTEAEMDTDYQKDGYATQKAIIMSKAMRKITSLMAKENVLLICTNQLREKLGVMFGEKYTTSGGKALGFHASVRLRMAAVKKIKAKDNSGSEVVIGMKTRVKVVKNRMGPPFREVEFDIYFDRGIDDYGGWLKMLKDYKVIKQSGSWYSYKEHKFQSKDFEILMDENPELKQELYDLLCDNYIVKYKKGERGIDDVIYEDFAGIGNEGPSDSNSTDG